MKKVYLKVECPSSSTPIRVLCRAKDGQTLCCPYQEESHCGDWCALFDISETSNGSFIYCKGHAIADLVPAPDPPPS